MLAVVPPTLLPAFKGSISRVARPPRKKETSPPTTVPLSVFTSEPPIQSATPWKNVSLLSSKTKNSADNCVRFIRLPKLERTKIKPRLIHFSASMFIGEVNRLISKTNFAHKLVWKKRLLKATTSTKKFIIHFFLFILSMNAFPNEKKVDKFINFNLFILILIK